MITTIANDLNKRHEMCVNVRVLGGVVRVLMITLASMKCSMLGLSGLS